jgi:GDP-L-fucose synthase
MQIHDRIYVAGGQTFVGAAILKRLAKDGYWNVLSPEDEPDLIQPSEVDSFFEAHAPDYVFVAAGDSGGIAANRKYPAELLRHNLLVECNVVHGAYRHGAKKLLYLASSCVYPRECPQPMVESSLLTGPLEPTNEAYALAKLAGIKLCQAYNRQYGTKFISAIPANIFGPGDDFSPEDSHVIAALIRRMHEARNASWEAVEVWGTGSPQRDFIFVDDLTEACVFIMKQYDEEQVPINIGGGGVCSIKELAELIKQVVGYDGELRFDRTKPDGMPLKVLDSSILNGMGWKPNTPFGTALGETYDWFLQAEQKVRPADVREIL